MNSIKDIGFIIHYLDYKESSKLLTIFCENGPVTILAKGAKKIKSPYISKTDLYTKVEFIYQESNSNTLVDISVLDDYHDIKENFKKTLALATISEVIKKSEEANPRIFNFLNNYYSLLRLEIDPLLIIDTFLIKCLYIFGINPNFQQNSPNDKLSIYDGVMTTDSNKGISSEMTHAFKYLYFLKEENKELINFKIDSMKLFKIIDKYYEIHLNNNFQTFKMIYETFKNE